MSSHANSEDDAKLAELWDGPLTIELIAEAMDWEVERTKRRAKKLNLSSRGPRDRFAKTMPAVMAEAIKSAKRPPWTKLDDECFIKLYNDPNETADSIADEMMITRDTVWRKAKELNLPPRRHHNGRRTRIVISDTGRKRMATNLNPGS